MTTPYREAPAVLSCPRCGEELDDVSGDVSVCSRCGGLWLGQPAIITAFHDPQWPHGVSMWWRRELVCPSCAATGLDETMSTVVVGDLMLDRCTEHGLWFDRGELARVIGGSAAKELEHLKGILESSTTPAWVIEQQQKDERERQARQAEEAEARHKREAASKAARDEEARKERLKEAREELIKERAKLDVQIFELVEQLREARETIETNEKQLGVLRSRLRMIENQLANLS